VGIIFIKILSMEEVHKGRRRRKTGKAREWEVEVHSGIQCTVRGIKKRNK
jgi:hypothetical protein